MLSAQLHAPVRFTDGERALDTHLIGGWVSPRSGAGALERDKPLSHAKKRTRFLGRPDRSLITAQEQKIQ